jgi:hypothetical protein
MDLIHAIADGIWPFTFILGMGALFMGIVYRRTGDHASIGKWMLAYNALLVASISFLFTAVGLWIRWYHPR